MQRIFEKNYIMDENDSLSEHIKIPLGHNRTNGAVYSKINFKVEIRGGFLTFHYNHYVYSDYLCAQWQLLLTLYVIEYL